MGHGTDAAAGVRALTFDCYGTLIDWEAGIHAALAELPSLEGVDLDRLAAERGEAERGIQRGPYLDYGEVLARSLAAAAALQERHPGEEELRRFAASMARWPPFPDASPALGRLARRFELAILSNVETAVLEESVRLLGVPFAALVTAQELRSYKPARAHFDEGLRRLGRERDEVLHVAVSPYHDVRPARELGWRTAWVTRGAEPGPEDPVPDLRVPDLAVLAEELEV